MRVAAVSSAGAEGRQPPAATAAAVLLVLRIRPHIASRPWNFFQRHDRPPCIRRRPAPSLPSLPEMVFSSHSNDQLGSCRDCITNTGPPQGVYTSSARSQNVHFQLSHRKTAVSVMASQASRQALAASRPPAAAVRIQEPASQQDSRSADSSFALA
jgi:hypothetical protein